VSLLTKFKKFIDAGLNFETLAHDPNGELYSEVKALKEKLDKSKSPSFEEPLEQESELRDSELAQLL